MFTRERTKSFFAENEKEFEEILKSDENNFSPRRKKKHASKRINFDEEEFENLLFKSSYVMEKETPSLEEQIKNEEKELYNFLKKLNKNSNNSDNESEITEDSCETNSLNNIFTEDEINNVIIPKNVKNYSKTIKFMVIGKSGVGKTFFINKFTNSNFDEKKYSKTENFEIKKIVVDFNKDNNIQFEFWDTSEKFINSSLISIYYKIANAFLFIIDENTSNDFINNQIKQIKNFVQNPKIFFIINNKNNNNNNINNNNFIINKNLLKNRNFINLNFCNIKNLFKFSDFYLFLESFFENKNINKFNNNLKRKINFQKNFYDEDKFLIKINN
jgi:GTPase SAR1 family protein